MHTYPKPLAEIVDALQHLPAVGPKTAERYGLALKDWPAARLEKLAEALADIASRLGVCERCFASALAVKDSPRPRCDICRSHQRTDAALCLVERESDIAALEKVGAFKGRYFILGGLLSPTKKNSRVIERLTLLKARLKKGGTKEIILALNPTPLGDVTAATIERGLRPLKIKITRLGRGLPTGSDVGYADDLTLRNAFSHREELKIS